MSGGTVTSARKSRSGDQPRSVTVNGAHRAAADHEMPHTVAQRHDVYVPRVSRTTTMHYAPPLLVQDLADRVSEIELSVQDVKDSQEKAHIATGLLGIAVLGIGLTRLYNHWRSSKIRPATPKIGKGSYTDADAKTTGNSHVLRPRKGCAAVNSVHEGNVSCSDGSEAGFSPSDNDSVPDKCHTDNGNSKLRLAVQPAHLPHAEPEVDYHELIPEPREAVRCLLRSINDLEPPHALALGDSAWCVGFSRHIGPRDTQEDYVIAFEVGRTRVCLLADGAGGHPLGEYASYHGILGAAAYIAEELAFAPEDQDLRLEEVARQSVHHAAFAIAVHAAAAGIPQRLALRSTLIVVLATDNEFSWANLGDGGGWSVRATPREYDSFLVPAKGEQPHQLTSSLGPTIHGEILSGTRPWGDADFLIVSSDGLADILDPVPFFETCLATCLQRQGAFSEAAEQLLQLVAESPDVSDNLSLGLVGRRRKPVLAV